MDVSSCCSFRRFVVLGLLPDPEAFVAHWATVGPGLIIVIDRMCSDFLLHDCISIKYTNICSKQKVHVLLYIGFYSSFMFSCDVLNYIFISLF